MIITVEECIENINKYRGCRVIMEDIEYYVYDTDIDDNLLLVSNIKSRWNAPFSESSFYTNPLLIKAFQEDWKFYEWLNKSSDLQLELLDPPKNIFHPLEDSEYINKLFIHLNLTLKSYDDT